ncbi:MAG: hypothetical protein IPN33_25810, partial [Saprospiraceae bacterium]|nr:hypothetical protein [Saprospiraceae bacterium]
ITGIIPIPESAKTARPASGIGMRYAGEGKPAECGLIGSGEIEDYTLVISQPYCADVYPSNNTTYEWIQAAQVGWGGFNDSGNNYGYGRFTEKVSSVNLGNQLAHLCRRRLLWL